LASASAIPVWMRSRSARDGRAGRCGAGPTRPVLGDAERGRQLRGQVDAAALGARQLVADVLERRAQPGLVDAEALGQRGQRALAAAFAAARDRERHGRRGARAGGRDRAIRVARGGRAVAGLAADGEGRGGQRDRARQRGAGLLG
jgi:hypothetical protein